MTETQKMLDGEPAMAELAKGELDELKSQKDALWSQMENITREEEKKKNFRTKLFWKYAPAPVGKRRRFLPASLPRCTQTTRRTARGRSAKSTSRSPVSADTKKRRLKFAARLLQRAAFRDRRASRSARAVDGENGSCAHFDCDRGCASGTQENQRGHFTNRLGNRNITLRGRRWTKCQQSGNCCAHHPQTDRH